MSVHHVVVIGAARSGTKALRDALAVASGSGTVPYDIGYVWRMRNEHAPDDVIDAEDVDGATRRRILTFIDKYARGEPATVIEKTVGNALRVPAVAAVLPDAKFVHLIRDGVDVIESTRRQWTAPIDLRYLAGKSLHVPLRLVPSLGLAYARSRIRRGSGAAKRVSTWGPRYPGLDGDLATTDLLTVCARQWQHSVSRATSDLRRLDLPMVEVRYEQLVEDPAGQLERVIEQSGLPHGGNVDRAAAGLTPERQGVGRQALTPTELAQLDAEVGTLLGELGYDRPTPGGTPTA